MISPCMNCEDRNPPCHDSCPRYKEFKKENDTLKNAVKTYSSYKMELRLLLFLTLKLHTIL